MTLVERARAEARHIWGAGQKGSLYEQLAYRIEALERDYCLMCDENRRLETALREIIAVRKARHLYQCEQDEDMADIARKALGEE